MRGNVCFLIIVSCLFGCCYVSAKKDLEEDLLNAEKKVWEEEMSKLNKEKCSTLSQIKILYEQIENQIADCLKSLDSRDNKDVEDKSDFPHIIAGVNSLRVQQEIIYQAERLINDTHKYNQKLELGTGVLRAEIISFKQRRENKKAMECWKLEGIMHEKQKPRLGFFPPLRDEVLVMHNELLIAQSELFGLMLEKKDLETTLKIDKALCEEKHRSLDIELEKLQKLPRENASRVMNQLQLEVAGKVKAMEGFRKKNGEMKEKRRWTEDAVSYDSDLANYAMFLADKYCFDKIISDVFTKEARAPNSKNNRFCTDIYFKSLE